MSEENVYVKTIKPVIGLLVIDPATSRALPEQGATVRGNAEYWIRRLNEGAVQEIADAGDAPPSDTESNQS
jgi:hypothetical protein